MFKKSLVEIHLALKCAVEGLTYDHGPEGPSVSFNEVVAFALHSMVLRYAGCGTAELEEVFEGMRDAYEVFLEDNPKETVKGKNGTLKICSLKRPR